jgi:hypothetical protein
LTIDSTGEKEEIHLLIVDDLAVLKFLDSTWNKSDDVIGLNFELKRTNNKRIDQVFSFHYTSQLFSNYELVENGSGQSQKEWVSGFSNPMALDLSYGLMVRILKSSRININYVTLRTVVSPTSYDIPPPAQNFVYKCASIESVYGFSVQSFIRYSLSKKLRWENYSHLFINAINRNALDLDFRNKFIFHLLKNLDVCLDSKIKYVPFPPYKVEYRNEFIISLSLDKW